MSPDEDSLLRPHVNRAVRAKLKSDRGYRDWN